MADTVAAVSLIGAEEANLTISFSILYLHRVDDTFVYSNCITFLILFWLF